MSDTNHGQRRRVLQGIGALLGGSALAGASAGSAAASADDDCEDEEFCFRDDGLVTVEGGEHVPGTVERIEDAIEEAGLLHVATIDHAENAASVGEELRPTTLLIFGNPEVGTPLMQENQSIGIDLPQKLLVWEGPEGEVNVTYNDPEYLAARHGLEENDETIGMIAEALAGLAESGQADG
jgi:uncharacterized protein (DUF302 family)